MSNTPVHPEAALPFSAEVEGVTASSEAISALELQVAQLRSNAVRLEMLSHDLEREGGDSGEIASEKSHSIEMQQVADAVQQELSQAREQSRGGKQKIPATLIGRLQNQLNVALTQGNVELEHAETSQSAAASHETAKQVAHIAKETPKAAEKTKAVTPAPKAKAVVQAPVAVAKPKPEPEHEPLHIRAAHAAAAAQASATRYVTEKAHEAKEAIRSAAKIVAESAPVQGAIAMASSAKKVVGEAAHYVAEVASDAAHAVGDRVKAAGRSVVRKARSFKNEVVRLAHKLPFMDDKDEAVTASAASGVAVGISAAPSQSAMARALDQAMHLKVPSFAGVAGLDALGDFSLPHLPLWAMRGLAIPAIY